MIQGVKTKSALIPNECAHSSISQDPNASVFSAASSSLPWGVLTLVEVTASCTLSIMNSLVILRDGSSLKRELIRATLAASRLASALLKQHLRKEEEEESLKDSAFHHFVYTSMGL